MPIVKEDDDYLDESDNEYDTCVSCGRSVMPDIEECPYCHKHPRGEYDNCSCCGAT